jgi:hypothetical protein
MRRGYLAMAEVGLSYVRAYVGLDLQPDGIWALR